MHRTRLRVLAVALGLVMPALAVQSAEAAVTRLVVAGPASFTPTVAAPVTVTAVDGAGAPQAGVTVSLDESPGSGIPYSPVAEINPSQATTGSDGTAAFTVTTTRATTLHARFQQGLDTPLPIVVQARITIAATGAPAVRVGTVPALRLGDDSHLGETPGAAYIRRAGYPVKLDGSLEVQRRPTGTGEDAWLTVARLSTNPDSAPLPVPTDRAGSWDVRVVDPGAPGRLPTLSPVATFQTTGTLASWHKRLDKRRAQAGLGPVVEDPRLSEADVKHARWQVLNRAIGHAEIPGTPGYSAEGNKAAGNSVVSIGSPDGATAVDRWIGGPFHATCLLSPDLLVAGYGQVGRSAALDCLGGTRGSSPGVRVVWPSPGTALPRALAANANEFPDAGAHCGPGGSRVRVWGTPVLLAASTFGLQSVTGAKATLRSGSKNIAVCVLTEANFRGADASQDSLGRAVLRAEHWVVVLPRAPLTPGRSYTATIRVGTVKTSTSFRVATR
jgi:hypothetical protein